MGTETIFVTRLNHSHLRIEGDQDVLKHIYEFFSFKSPNAKFDPRVKSGKWSGVIHLFNLRKKTLPVGLASKLLQFAKLFNYDVTFCNKVQLPSKNGLSAVVLDEFIASLNLPFVPHDYQLKAVNYIVANKRGIIESPTSSGKSLIINILSQWAVVVKNYNVLIIVPTIGLVTQMYKDFVSYGTEAELIYTITAGVRKEDIVEPIVISTWQSILKQDADWFSRYGAVFGDEVHGFEAKSLVKIMEACENAAVRAGFTGTLRDGECSIMTLEGLFGPRKKYVSTADLIDRDICSALEIKCNVLQYSKADKKLVHDRYVKATKGKPVEIGAREAYQAEISFIENHTRRTNFICDLAIELSKSGNPLIIFNHLAHGQELFLTIRDKTDNKIPLYYVDGSVSKDERELVRINAEQENCIIVAASGVFSTGVNIKNLNFLIMAAPTKSKIRVLQSIGRILRKAPNGRGSEVFDIVDDLSYSGRKNYALRSAEERLRIYEDEQFKFTVELLDLEPF